MLSRNTLCLALLFCFTGLLRAEETATPFESLNFDDALRKAGAEHKLVLIDFFTTWCGPCKMLDRQTWANPEVQAVLREKTVALKLDAEKETTLAKRYAIDAYPTTLILNADGSIKDKYVGFMPPPAFLEHFMATLQGKTSLDQAAEAVEQARQRGEHELVEARYRRGQECARAGRFKEALADFLWCYDEGMIRDSSYAGVRNSYLLAALRRLASQYPAANDAMAQRRDQARKDMFADPGQRRATMDFASINRYLGQKEENMTTFRNLPKGDPRRQLLDVYDELLIAGNYEDALEALPDERFHRLIALQEQEARGEGFAKEHPELQTYSLNELRRQILGRIPALIATRHMTEAKTLRELLLKVDTSISTRQALDKACATLN